MDVERAEAGVSDSNGGRSYMHLSDRPSRQEKQRYYPVVIVIVTLLLWGTYIYGLVFIIKRSDLEFNLMQPLSPPLRGWYFYTVTSWPGCNDVRAETGRLFSYQFVHASPMHIMGNTIAMLLFGSIFNIFMGFWSTGLIYVLAIFMGGMGHSLVWPYKGLVGCSPGVYGLIGACWVLLLFHHRRLEGPILFVLPCVLVTQVVGDTLSYLYFYSASVGYASHFFGYLTGIFVAMALLLGELRCQPLAVMCARKVVGLAGLAAFALMATYLVTQYVASGIPDAVERGFLHNVDADSGTCCAQLFAYAASSGQSVTIAKETSYCVNDQLYHYNR